MKRGAQVVGAIMLSVAAPERRAVLDGVRDCGRIVEWANLACATGFLGHLPGESFPGRVPVNCNRTGACAIGFPLLLRTTGFGADVEKVEVRQELNGVRAVAERGSAAHSESRNLGGWMAHGFRDSSARLFTDETDPDFGAARVSACVNGSSAGTNPAATEGRAAWRGFVPARDASVTDSIGNHVTGDARIDVTPDGVTALADVFPGQPGKRALRCRASRHRAFRHGDRRRQVRTRVPRERPSAGCLTAARTGRRSSARARMAMLRALGERRVTPLDGDAARGSVSRRRLLPANAPRGRRAR